MENVEIVSMVSLSRKREEHQEKMDVMVRQYSDSTTTDQIWTS